MDDDLEIWLVMITCALFATFLLLVTPPTFENPPPEVFYGHMVTSIERVSIEYCEVNTEAGLETDMTIFPKFVNSSACKELRLWDCYQYSEGNWLGVNCSTGEFVQIPPGALLR
jgi:hypothetical protein